MLASKLQKIPKNLRLFLKNDPVRTKRFISARFLRIYLYLDCS